jgi:hypothetical protein
MVQSLAIRFALFCCITAVSAAFLALPYLSIQ